MKKVIKYGLIGLCIIFAIIIVWASITGVEFVEPNETITETIETYVISNANAETYYNRIINKMNLKENDTFDPKTKMGKYTSYVTTDMSGTYIIEVTENENNKIFYAQIMTLKDTYDAKIFDNMTPYDDVNNWIIENLHEETEKQYDNLKVQISKSTRANSPIVTLILTKEYDEFTNN